MDMPTQHAGDLSFLARIRVPLTLVPWRMRGTLVLMAVAAILMAGLDLLGVIAMMPLTQLLTNTTELPSTVTRYLVPLFGTDDHQRLLLYCALFVGVMFILKDLVMLALRWWSIGQMGRASAAAQAALLHRYVHATYASHRGRTKPEILQTVTSTVNIAFTQAWVSVISLITDLATAVALLGTLLVLAPLPSLVAVVIFGGAALLMVRVVKPHALRFGVQTLRLNTRMWSYVNPAVEGFRESRIFGREDFFVEQFARNRREIVQPERKQQILGELPRYLMEIVMIFGILLVGLLLFATSPQSTAFGLLAIFAAASVRIAPSLNRAVTSVNTIRTSLPAVDRLVDQIAELDATQDAAPESRDDAGGLPESDIVVSGLGFTYPDADTPVLEDVSVTIPRGHTVALVGSSGAGKTTFADILLGLFSPTSGTITVGDVDVVAHPGAWRRSVAAVSQRVYLWDATIRDLITYGQPVEDIDPQLLVRVIRQAQLESLLDSLPEGLDTRVGESGTRLSGGQAQRIGIARALYAQPQVLILDEATSALDNETEHEITSTIEALHGQMTVIVIAHRLSTVRNADEILFFSQGRLADRGTMSDLRETNDEFARLVELGQLT
ncbi:Protein glycosylation K [bioreactor metagenome]|uniref:Protein glycosylation K n=2 Tax=root TaxID=1 RepID=A0A644Z894_9ZZZZ